MITRKEAASLLSRLRRHTWFLLLLWTLCVGGSLVWNVYEQREKVMRIARNSTLITFENDVLYRKWVAGLGGVYVPVSREMPPNPYLAVPNRDIVTTAGMELTLVNPAYMTRKVNQVAADLNGSKGHLTSLRPLRPENSPDPWEADALQSFEHGNEEVCSIQMLKGEEHFRLMRPFITESACLKCHGAQGYKAGDVRGGISVSLPMGPLWDIERPLLARMTVAHVALWAFGIVGVAGLQVRLKRQIDARERNLRELELLTQTAGDLLQSTEPQKVVESLCRKAMEHLDCHVFFNFLVDERAGKLRLNAYAGIPADEARKIEWLEYGTAVCGCAARDGCRIVAEHIPTTPDPRTELIKSYGVKAYACHPLLGPGGESLGTLSFGTRGREAFSERDLALMKAMSDQVAVAMVRMRGELALRHVADELARSNNDLQQFGYVASHDLQEPLRMVRGFMQLLQRRHGTKLDDDANECIRYAMEGAGRMSQLITDLLEYSRVQSRERQPAFTDMKDVFDSAVANCRGNIEETGAAVTRGELPAVMADRTQLVQLLQNLIGNAIKFRRPGVKPQVAVGARRQGDHWVMWVKDNGIGIAPEYRERIFLIFQRLHTRDQYPGTGIGLAICKKIVERHGGSIWVESKPEDGSTFYFTLGAQER